MNGETYDTMETEDIYAMDAAENDYGEVDDMLDSLIDSAGDGDFGEARRSRRSRMRARSRSVPTAPGRSAYREPVASAGGPVNQKQFKDALDRVGADIRRNAEGIKTINARLNTLDSRVSGVVTVAAAHGRRMTRLDRQAKVDGTLELVQALGPGGTLDAFQLLKGAVKFGVLGGGTGALSNPLVIGGIGLLLRNPNILGGFGTSSTSSVP
jgi:hypothetical protein